MTRFISEMGDTEVMYNLLLEGKALFQGYLNTTPPKDGRIKKAGFCAINSKRKIVSD